MFIILFHTLTLFPALLSCWLRVDPARVDAEHLRFHRAWWGFFEAHPKGVVLCAALAGVVSVGLMPQLRFDANVIRMRNPDTESVRAFNDLLEESGSASPWFINSVAPSLAEAVEWAERMNELDAVSQTLTLADYVPSDQEEKLEILADIAFLMEVPPAPLETAAEDEEMDVALQIEALTALYVTLAHPWTDEGSSPLRESMRVLRDRLEVFLARVEAEEGPEAALRDFEALLMASFPDQIARLRRSIEAAEVRREDLPPELVERMITPTGRARVQVFPSETLIDESSFARFSDSVREIDPRATGVAVNLLEFGRATRDSFKQALISAFVVISLLLWLLWRHLSLVLLALAPMVLSSALTCAGMVLLDMPFNFANVVVIPLLLGIGIDSGIHLVHRAEYPDLEGASLLESTTARAVYYSAVTTTVSFGTLAFSSHQGMASLGILLTMGMLITVVSNLVVLPALLQLRGR
jgi:hopanoid biosynthesis associated RND transporter like protein HpnN